MPMRYGCHSTLESTTKAASGLDLKRRHSVKIEINASSKLSFCSLINTSHNLFAYFKIYHRSLLTLMSDPGAKTI